MLSDQYHGGTNFGRSAGGPFITTSYDYDAPLDEYGNVFCSYGHFMLSNNLKSIQSIKTVSKLIHILFLSKLSLKVDTF